MRIHGSGPTKPRKLFEVTIKVLVSASSGERAIELTDWILNSKSSNVIPLKSTARYIETDEEEGA